MVRGTTRHKWDKRQRIKDQHGEREIALKAGKKEVLKTSLSSFDQQMQARKRVARINKTGTPNEGWEKDRVPTCASRIL